MNDREPRSLNTDSGSDTELEDRLREHYAATDPGSSRLLTSRVSDALETGPTRWEPGRAPANYKQLAMALAGMGVLLVIALIGNLLLHGGNTPSGPQAGSPSSSSSASPGETAWLNATSTPAMTEGYPPVLATGTMLGRIKSGGVWWAQDTSFDVALNSTSSSGYSPWPVSDTEPPAVFVLDEAHAWSVTVGSGSSNPYAGQGPDFDHLQVIVNRTSDRGLSWKRATVPGDYADSVIDISFVDEMHGFLMCSSGRPGMTSTVLRTDDGGATWTVVSTTGWLFGQGANLGGVFTASDANTLWAGSQPEAGGHGHPLLAVSRDAGRTWSEVDLPGMSAYVGGFETMLLDPPTFLDSKTGFVAVAGPSPAVVFATTDGGLTWTRHALPVPAMRVDYVDARRWFAYGAATLQTTDDGGLTWHLAGGQGLPQGSFGGIAMVDASTGYALYTAPGYPAHYYLYRTQSGGESWTAVWTIAAEPK